MSSHRKKHMLSQNEKLTEAFSELSEKRDSELREFYMSCLKGEHSGYLPQSSHAEEAPEDILWWILRSEENVVRLKKPLLRVLEEVIYNYVQLLPRIERGEENVKIPDTVEKALRVIQKGHSRECKGLLRPGKRR